MTQARCPQCTAPMRPTTVGELHDKILRCDHCGTEIDVPDEVTVEHASERTETDGRGRRVTVSRRKTITRRDLQASGSGGDALETAAPVVVDLDDREALRAQLREVLGADLPEGAEVELGDVEFLTEDGQVLVAAADGSKLVVGGEHGEELRELIAAAGGLGADGQLQFKPGTGNDLITEVTVERHETVDSVLGPSPEAETTGAAEAVPRSTARRRAPVSLPQIPTWLIIVAGAILVILAIIILG